MNKERSQSTKKGLRAEALVRKAVKGRKGICDVHTEKGGFEIRWGATTKNSAGLAADRARAKNHGGYCVQVYGLIPSHYRLKGDRSLWELLVDHGYDNEEARTLAHRIQRDAADDQALVPLSEYDGQLPLPSE